MTVTSLPISRVVPERKQISDGGDAPAAGWLFWHKHRSQAKWLWWLFAFFVTLAVVTAYVDIAVIKGVMTAKFSDEFGLIAEGQETWIWLASCLTVLFFLAIGRLYYSGALAKKLVAVMLYAVLLCFIAINIHSSYLSEFLQIFGASAAGWGVSVAGVVDAASPTLKVVFMLIISVVMTGPGLMFAWAERRVELAFKDLMQNSLEMHEAQALVGAFEKTKEQSDAEADKEREREQRHEFFSDTVNQKTVGKSTKASSRDIYLATLKTQLAALPKKTLQMSRAEQATNEAKRVDLTARIAKAQSLNIH
jgi:hypothetical protein